VNVGRLQFDVGLAVSVSDQADWSWLELDRWAAVCVGGCGARGWTFWA